MPYKEKAVVNTEGIILKQRVAFCVKDASVMAYSLQPCIVTWPSSLSNGGRKACRN